MIEEFWIINSYGVPLFHLNVKNGKRDDSIEAITKSTLFAGMWTAINTVAQQFNNDSINSIHLGSQTLSLKKSESYNLLFIANAPRDVKDKQINKILDKLMNSFIGKYSSVLIGWNGNIEQFMSFYQEVEKVVNDSYPEKFQRTLADI